MYVPTFLQCVRKPLVFIALLALATAPLAAQTGLGVVRGTVLDATSAAVPAAKVTLTNTATGVARSAESNSVGVYYFASVPIGPYSLAVEASGFKRWSGTLSVAAGQNVVIDPSLEVGSLEATVEVTGAAPVLTTVGSEVNDVKDALRIQQLPLNGRFVTNLFNLTPGVEGGGNPRVNGLKVGSTEMLLDGISLVDRFGGGISRVQPGLDVVQEFRIETVGSGAQFSRPATVTLVSKSGTNEFHGSVFETHRNNFGGLRARQKQDTILDPDTGKFRQAQYIRNEYGVSAGGPVIKNKTFWFAAYEASKLRQSQYAEAQAPSEAMWSGDLSLARPAGGYEDIPVTVYDPLTTGADGSRLPFTNNQIPSNRLSDFSKVLRSVSALPNTNLGENPFLAVNFKAYYPVTTDISSLTLKGDHVFSEKDNISGRFTRSPRANKTFGGRFGYPIPGSTDAGGTGRSLNKVYSSFARWNHVFSPSFLNEFQASNHRSPHTSGTLADDTDWPAKLGTPNPFGATGWPTMCMSEYQFFYWGCWDADNRADQNLTAFQIEDNVTWIKGKHNVKFGFKGRQEYNNVRELQQTHGSHSFYNSWTSLYDPANESATPYTGSGMAGILLGLPTYLSNQYNRGYFYFQQKELGLYVHDSWKVSPRLTLELGVRWDKWTIYKEKYNRLVNLDINDYVGKFEVITPHDTRMEDIPGIPPSVLGSYAARGLTWKTANSVGFPSALLPNDNNNFGPRLGFAFRVTDKWVLRGGYGEYFWTMPLSQITQSSRTNIPLNLRYENQVDIKNGADDFYALRNAPAPDDYIGRATVDINGLINVSSRAQPVMPWDIHSWKDNRAQEWNFTIERELMKETALRLSYIGTHGLGLEQRVRWNDPESEYNYQARTGLIRSSNPDLRRANPNWTSGCCNAPVHHIGYSNSQSLQAEIERRYSNGLAFQWFYTWSHAMTTSDTGGFNFGSSGINSSGSGSAFAVPENILILGEPNLSLDDRLKLGYANSDSVPAHRIRYNGIYTLPFGKGKKYGNSAGRGLDAVIGGWELAFIGDWRSGYWAGVSSGRYLFGDPTLSGDERLEMTYQGKRQRLWFRGDFPTNLATDVDAAKLSQLIPDNRAQRVLRPVGDLLDNRIPMLLADGSVRYTPIGENLNWNARNFFRDAGAWNLDFSIFKNFSITERIKTRFTADFFNVFNHPLEGGVIGGYLNTTTGLQDLSVQPNDPRIIQFSLRVSW
jgi:hypothetical protein